MQLPPAGSCRPEHGPRLSSHAQTPLGGGGSKNKYVQTQIHKQSCVLLFIQLQLEAPLDQGGQDAINKPEPREPMGDLKDLFSSQ